MDMVVVECLQNSDATWTAIFSNLHCHQKFNYSTDGFDSPDPLYPTIFAGSILPTASFVGFPTHAFCETIRFPEIGPSYPGFGQGIQRSIRENKLYDAEIWWKGLRMGEG